MEQIFLTNIFRYMKDKKVTGNSHNSFTKNNLRFSSLVAFCDVISGGMAKSWLSIRLKGQ